MTLTAVVNPDITEGKSLVVSQKEVPAMDIRFDASRDVGTLWTESLVEIETHYVLASATYKKVVIDLARPIPTEMQELLVLMVRARCKEVVLKLPREEAVSAFATILELIYPIAHIRFMCVKGKRVGEIE